MVDFLLDDERWAVRYLVAETRSFLTDRKVLISPVFFRQSDWSDRRFRLALTKEKIEHSPNIDADKPVSRQGSDGEIGHVIELFVDEETWQVRYLAINAGSWVFGKKVLIAPQWAKRISWDERKVYLDLSRQQIKNSPAWNGTEIIDREYESRLHKHYGHPAYWDDLHHPGAPGTASPAH